MESGGEECLGCKSSASSYPKISLRPSAKTFTGVDLSKILEGQTQILREGQDVVKTDKRMGVSQ